MISIEACRKISMISSKAAPRLRAAAAPGGQYCRLLIRSPSLRSTQRMCPPPVGADHAGQVSIAHGIRRRSTVVLNAFSGSKDGVVTVAEQLKRDILAAVAGTSCGVRADGITRGEVEALLAKLEASNPTPEPAISAGMDGDWAVAYTDAPPPSNGVLGPFTGRAFQNIDLQAGEYENLLKVGGIEQPWLTASLMAGWEVLDGGTWRVLFRDLTIRLFGLRLLRQEFQETTRVWKVTYLDNDTRIMRAGRTGAAEDDFVFYLQRTET